MLQVKRVEDYFSKQALNKQWVKHEEKTNSPNSPNSKLMTISVFFKGLKTYKSSFIL